MCGAVCKRNAAAIIFIIVSGAKEMYNREVAVVRPPPPTVIYRCGDRRGIAAATWYYMYMGKVGVK